MSLESMAGLVTDPGVRTRLLRTVDDLDDTIRRIRSSIFAPQESRSDGTSVAYDGGEGPRPDQPLLGFRPRTRLNGPPDTLVSEDIVADVEAVLRESLTNVAKHAHASAVQVDVAADSGQLRLVIIDDGVGLNHPERHSGLGNREERAERRGGSLTLSNQPEEGFDWNG